VTAIPHITAPEACDRVSRGEGCGVERCGLCEARSLSICNAIEESRLGELARATSVIVLEPGDVFRHEGDPPDYLFNIISGAVKLFKLLPDGRRQIVGFLGTGDFVGFGGRDAAPCSAEAITSARLCRFERGRFRALLDAHPGLERRLLAVASDEIAAGQEHMMLLGRMSATERVARFLLARADASRRRGETGDSFPLPMSRADIGDYLGLTTETVSRTFTQLRDRRLIRYDVAKRVVLHDREALSALAGGG
jgi:CRP/FNR family transcriptional regulator, anaerobic regulatory protein